MTISARPLTPNDWSQIEALFTQRGACGGCWCMYWRRPKHGKVWEESKGEPNRLAFKALVEAGQVQGALAFSGETPVGWCAVGPWETFAKLAHTKALQVERAAHTWAITCFVIPTPWRGRGVASALLQEASALAQARGARALEGYPVVPKEGKRLPAAFAWTGVPRLFEGQDFVEVPAPGARPVYRRELEED